MNPEKTFWRFFLAHQDGDQEAWFEAQARQGWHLTRPGLFAFRFRQGEPQSSRYRIDFQNNLQGIAKAEYLQLFHDAGWECLGFAGNRAYFRAQPDALSPEIFTDPESRRDRIKRELRLLVFLCLFTTWNTFQLSHRTLQGWGNPTSLGTVLAWITPPLLVLNGLAALLLGWCAWRLAQALKQDL